MTRRSSTDGELQDLATFLARAYLRLAKTSRPDAVSCASTPHDSLDVLATESPDHDVEPATRRAS